MRDLLAHERVEVRVEAVHGAVDADGDPRLGHLVDERGDPGGDQVGGAPGHALAHVPHGRHVRLGRVRQPCKSSAIGQMTSQNIFTYCITEGTIIE